MEGYNIKWEKLNQSLDNPKSQLMTLKTYEMKYIELMI